MNANEAAIAMRSQYVATGDKKQLLLVYTTTVIGGTTDHHYAFIELKPVLDVKSISISANGDGTLGLDMVIINKGTWALASGEKSAFIYQGDEKKADTQISASSLPAIAVGATDQSILTLTVPSVDGGYIWVEITEPSDTYLDFATSFGFPVYPHILFPFPSLPFSRVCVFFYFI